MQAFLELHPNSGDRHWLAAKMHLAKAQYEQALSAIAADELAHLRLSISAIALHHLGRLQESETTLQELITTDGEASAFQVAGVYAQRGDLEATLNWLNVALSKRDPGLAEVLSSGSFRPLYGEAAFQRFLSEIGLGELVDWGGLRSQQQSL